jgi:homospermidine synthase
MAQHRPAAEHASKIGGRLAIVGFGSVGQGALPLILRHIALDPKQITIIAADERGRECALRCGVADFRVQTLTPENFRELLAPLLGASSFLLNLSVDVSSIALIELCQELGARYLDSCIEPWAGGYTDPHLSAADRSNYRLREQALAINRRSLGRRPTALVTHGVNPGLVSHFTKQALLDMARDLGRTRTMPTSRADWAQLAMELEIKVIHIAERDTQVSAQAKQRDEFVNTWSVEAFVSEGSQPAELGWGTHEKALPSSGRTHARGGRAAIYLDRPGVSVRVRSWTPLEGSFHGLLITHAESISIAEYLTVSRDDEAIYRPTVHYAYHPCDEAILSVDEFNGRGLQLQSRRRVLKDEITQGMDELGVLLCGNPAGVYWYGSRLTIGQARVLAPYNNATTLQTAAGVLAGMVWVLDHDGCGVVEPEAMDFERVLDVARPYLGELVGVWGDWTPLAGRRPLFAEPTDDSDPWQFTNILVA